MTGCIQTRDPNIKSTNISEQDDDKRVNIIHLSTAAPLGRLKLTMDSFFNQQNLLFHQQLQVRRRLDGPSKLFCSSLIFFIVLFSAGIVSVLTAPRFIPRSCDKSRTVLDSPWGIVSDDTHPSTNGNYTQVSTLVNKQIIRS